MRRWGRLLLLCVVSVLAHGAAPAGAAADVWQTASVPKISGVTSLSASRAFPGLAWAQAESVIVDGKSATGITTDGGKTWQPSYWLPGRFAAATRSNWWSVGPSGQSLQHSVDSGASWQGVPSFAPVLASLLGPDVPYGLTASPEVLLTDPTRPDVLYVIAVVGSSDSSDERVIETTDGGATWQVWSTDFFVYSNGSDAGFQTTWRPLPGQDALLLGNAGTAEPGRFSSELDVVTPTGVRQLQRHTGTYDSAGRPVGIELTSRMDVDSTGSRVLLETNRHGWALSVDAGVHFGHLGLALPAGGVAPVFDPSRQGQLYAIRFGVVWRSGNDGRTWQRLAHGLIGAASLEVDAAGELYAYGASGLAISRDHGRTFTRSHAYAVPVQISMLRQDARGNLLAATGAGVFRLGRADSWTPIDRATLPMAALDAAPLGSTPGVLAVRADTQLDARHPVPVRLEALTHGVWRRIRTPGSDRLATSWFTAFASDASARRIVLGRVTTRDGGLHWRAITGPAIGPSRIDPSQGIWGVESAGQSASRVVESRDLKRFASVAVIQAPACTVIDASRGGVYVYCVHTLWHSRGRGSRFVPLPLPRTATSVSGMVADPRHPGMLALMADVAESCPGYIDTYGNVTATRRGVFVTHDDGATWRANDDACVPIDSIDVGPLPIGSPIFEGGFAFDGSGRLLQFGTAGGPFGLAVLQSTNP
jgi:hypothetical protein